MPEGEAANSYARETPTPEVIVMTHTTELEQAVTSRIAEKIAKIMQTDSFFQKLDADELTQHYSALLLKHWTSEQVLAFSDEEITKMLKGMMAFRGIFGLLDNLTPEQQRMFDEAVEGR